MTRALIIKDVTRDVVLDVEVPGQAIPGYTCDVTQSLRFALGDLAPWRSACRR